ncbi:putative RNA-dependent RNA polymerase SHL2 [Leucoagaricus sp. SymC.cos]|nr:putative RNA-dependent RNA polymerase SHL2 [Leucoagaricus sp. SymC.cos]
MPCAKAPTYRIQNAIKSRNLPYSVEWELARLVSKGIRTWEGEGENTITLEDLDFLRILAGSQKPHSEGAKKISERFLAGEKGETYRSEGEKNATDPWTEFEKEDAFAVAHPNSVSINEKGGKIHFTATLKQSSARKHSNIPEYKIELNQAELGPSCSFSRRFGSKCFFRLKIPKTIIGSDTNLIEFLCKPIILCQGVYRAFYAKEQTAFYFRTSEIWNDGLEEISPPHLSSPGFGLRQFLAQHNPIETNQGQTMAKWAARFALGLSSSIHGITLEKDQIEVIDDIKSDQGSDMTDGAGFISRRLLQKLTHIHDWPTRPSAIQVRVRGSKGLLIEHPTMDNDKLCIQLRPSLIKIQYFGPLHVAQRSIDILRTSHARSPTRINVDVIVNLHANGVPFSAFKELMTQSIDSIIRPLLNWDSDDRTALHELWLNYERSGSVLKSRRAREDVALARVSGYTERDTTEEVNEDDEEAQEFEDAMERSVEWWPDDVSGCPSSLEETIMAFIDSGFNPAINPMLREKIFAVVSKTISRNVENCTIDLPFSASAWIIPDPSGVLEPGQLFFKSSHSNLLTVDGTETDILTGNVLITRDPCRLPTDVQKWEAVDVSQLHYLKDVIVLSVKGPRRAADWLAGGDYDGDKAKLIWQPALVRDFRNADPHFADPPRDLDSYFSINNERVGDFLDRVRPMSEEQQLQEMQKFLLGSMKDQGEVGRYSSFHEYSTCVNGYDHEKTKLLAYLFTTVLDGRKTGKIIRDEVLRQHQKEFGMKKLNWKESLRKKSEGELAPQSNVNPTRNPKFIMERLVNFGKHLEETKLAELERKKQSFSNDLDHQLLAPLVEVDDMIKRNRKTGENAAADYLKKDLDLIRAHVEAMHHEHREQIRQASLQYNEKKRSNSVGAGFTNLPIQKRQDILRRLSKKFHSEPPREQFTIMSEVMVDRVKAAYAYFFDSKEAQPSRFPWNVAFRDLCSIKAGKDIKPVHKRFYDYMSMKLGKRRKHYYS